ncbi:MAG: hypothetical protein LBN08_00210 [Lactobacillales bacterium]|nr:hypothetical protein [Lactobacillales bacterium]
MKILKKIIRASLRAFAALGTTHQSLILDEAGLPIMMWHDPSMAPVYFDNDGEIL